MLSRNLEESLHRAIALASERRHEYATLEHLLFALTEDRDAIAVIRACGVDIEKASLSVTYPGMNQPIHFIAGILIERALHFPMDWMII